MKHRHLLCTISAAAVIALALTSCGRQELPWYEDTGRLWKDYMAAVEDAKVAVAEKMDPDLATIVSPAENPQIEWLERDGRTFVLVGSVMTEEESRYWEDGQADMFLLDDRLPWVSLPYDLTARLKADARQTDDQGIVMRVVQMLGLPPDYCGNRIVLFWAEKDSLFRPTPDPEIHDSEVLLDFRDDVDPRYRAWFEDYCRTAYYSDTPYPWTRLGYTYDWHSGSPSAIGPAEFLVRPSTRVIVRDILPVPEWYRTLTTPATDTLVISLPHPAMDTLGSTDGTGTYTLNLESSGDFQSSDISVTVGVRKNKFYELLAGNDRRLILIIFSICAASALITLAYRYKKTLKQQKQHIADQAGAIPIIKSEPEKHHETTDLMRFQNMTYETMHKLADLYDIHQSNPQHFMDKSVTVARDYLTKTNSYGNAESLLNSVYPGFLDELRAEFPKLKKEDFHLITLTCIDYPSSIVCSILNISETNLSTKKYRLARKMNLDTSLTKYLNARLSSYRKLPEEDK